MGRDDLSTGGAETMNAASTQPRSFDVLCAGLAVGNVVVRPVPEHFSGGDTVQVQEISMMGGGDAFNQACVLAALGEKPALLSRMADDDSGRMMRAALQKRGVDDRFVFSDPATGTSTCIVLIKENAQRSFLTFKGCLRNFGDGDIDYTCVRQARLVSIGGLFSLPSFDRSASIRLLQAARTPAALRSWTQNMTHSTSACRESAICWNIRIISSQAMTKQLRSAD